MSTPLVSICCLTYNHAPFIRKCLDGFLMQQTDFPIEILIHDDCSTDGTTEIIKEYAAQYPDVIFPLYEEENKYSRGGAGKMDLYNYNRARGRYIAYCEGDDYWTDPLKLQKQVDFMESHPEYSVCFHGFEEYDVRNQQHRKIDFSAQCEFIDGGIDITPAIYLRHSYWGQPLTMLFRVSMFDFSWRDRYKYYRDTHEIYHLLNKGKGRMLNFVGGVYNLHNGGVATSMTTQMSALTVRETYKELYIHNAQDKVIQLFLYEILLWNYNVCSSKKFLCICKELFVITPGIVLKVLFTILKRKIKFLFKYNV